jgi:predicted helicase
MRQQLMKSFTDIYVLDLHGNTRSKEKSPDNQKDENVFDIQQGVCISFFIKNPKNAGNTNTNVFRADLWGLRTSKYDFLDRNDISTMNWKKFLPFSPWYMFYPLKMDRWRKYRQGWKITEVFSEYSVGIMTGQDKLTIKNNPGEIQEIVEDFILKSESEMKRKYDLPKKRRQWSYQKAKNDILQCGISSTMKKSQIRMSIKERIVPILYRPFDIRFTFYTGRSRGFHERPRGDLMKHMLLDQNLGLLVSRNSKPSSWRDVQITENIIELGAMATRPGNNAPLFPLYSYVQTSTGLKKEINFTQEFKTYIKDTYGSDKRFTVKKILYYIFAILHSQEYRKKYAEFLKIDFPRIPMMENKDLFFKIAKIGEELANIHLLRFGKITLNTSKVTLHEGNMRDSLKIKKVQYSDKNQLWINNQTYFAGISTDVYEYHIGSYRICQKWLIRFKNCILGKSEVNTFINIVWVIEQTLQRSKEIDELIETHGGWETSLITTFSG